MEDGADVPDDVGAVLRIRYHIVFPVFIALTIITNVPCLLVTTRPKLRAYHSNVYIQLMTIGDLLSSFALLPFVFEGEFCSHESYICAFYFTHFGYMLTHCLRGFGSYALLFLSYDRFLAIWYTDRFREIKHKGVTKRMVMVAVLLVASYTPEMYIGSLTSQSDSRWLGIPGVKLSGTNWLSFYKSYKLIIACILPSVLIVGLSMGLVYGIVKKHIITHDAGRKRRRQLFQTLAVLWLNVSYVICIIPYLVAVANYKIEKGKCYSTARSEIILMVTHACLMLWSTVNIIIYFGVNKEFLKEIKKILSVMSFLKINIEDDSREDGTSATDRINQNVLVRKYPQPKKN